MSSDKLGVSRFALRKTVSIVGHSLKVAAFSLLCCLAICPFNLSFGAPLEQVRESEKDDAQAETTNVTYRSATPVAMVIEIDGTARRSRQGQVFYEPLREGDVLYQEEKIFVSALSKVLLEQRTKAASRLVNLPALTIYAISRSTGTSDLLVRSLFPNSTDIEERIANQKANTKRAPRKSPLGRFDILSLQSALQNTERSLDTVSFSEGKSQFSDMTALTVYDLSLLTFLIPTGRVNVYRGPNGFPAVNFQLSKPHPSPLLVSVWEEAPELKAEAGFHLGPGTQNFSWRPSRVGTFALQALSVETGVRSQVSRIFAADGYSPQRLIPGRIRPNDMVVIPYSTTNTASAK